MAHKPTVKKPDTSERDRLLAWLRRLVAGHRSQQQCFGPCDVCEAVAEVRAAIGEVPQSTYGWRSER